MNLSKIHHIAIIVSDYEAAKDFYANKLGFSVIRENYRPERKDWKLDLRVNELTELEIFAEENPPKRVNRPEACGLRHLAFCVESVEQTLHRKQGDAAHMLPGGSHASAVFPQRKSPVLCAH